MRTMLRIAGLWALAACPTFLFAQDQPPAPANPEKAAAREEPSEDAEQRWAIGLGGGFVDIGERGVGYLSANVRYQAFGGRADDVEYTGDYSQGARGYLEAEVGYWKSDEDVEEKDTLVGLNLVGELPMKGARIFLGAGVGAHLRDVPSLGDDETRFGANVHFGVELPVNDRVGLFGVGRMEVVEGENDLGSKIWVGIRFHP